MKTYEIKNARIDYTRLGVKYSDHGILSFVIGLDYGGSGQGYGQICLDTWNEKRQKRTPTSLASSLLLSIDELFGLDWEDLKGQSCRAYATNSYVAAIGHFLKDKWLWCDEELLEFRVTPFSEIKTAEYK